MTAAKTMPSLRLRDPRDIYAPAATHAMRVVSQLPDAGALPEDAFWHAPFWPAYRDPASYDHLVVADDQAGGRPLAMLGADVLNTGEEEFLIVNAAFVAAPARGGRVLRRMLATALLQAARQGPVPRVIAARSLDPLFYRSLRLFARGFGVTLYPEVAAPALSLRAAALARRVARCVSPTCRFEPGVFALRGTAAAYGLRRAVPLATEQDAAIDAMFARQLGDGDQFLLLLDLRGLSAATILEAARRIRRQR